MSTGMEAPGQTKSPWRIVLVLCLGAFAVMMDTTIVNVAIPNLVVDLGASLDHVLWINNSYLLVFGALLIVMSRFGDIFGPRKLFNVGLIVFGVSSVLCGLAQSPTQLIIARALQGLGAAMMSPQPLVLITATFPANGRGAALGVFTSMVGFAAVIGPTLGGVLVQFVGWRSIFFVNVPIVIAAVLLCLAFVPDLRLGRKHRLDWGGVVLATLGMLLVVFGLVEGERYDWGAIENSGITIFEVIAVGVVLLLAFIWWEWRQRASEPLVPLRLFRDPVLTMLAVLHGVVQFTLIGQMIIMGLNFQSVLGMSAVVAGLTGLPLTVTLTIIAPYTGRLSDRIGSRSILVIGFLVYAIGMILLGMALALDATTWTFVFPLALMGVGMGCLFAPMTIEALRRCPPEHAGALSGVLNTTRQLGAVIGSAVIGAVLAAQLATAQVEAAATEVNKLPEEARPAFLAAFENAAANGLQVGRGQTGGALVPEGLSGSAAEQFRNASHEVFTRAYIDAARYTLWVPAILLLLGGVACFIGLRRRPAAPQVPQQQQAVAPAEPAHEKS